MATKRNHKATFARDKRAGGYLIRVAGPFASRFAGREVPVLLKSGDEHMEQLQTLVWSGIDEKTGENIALYSFEAKPKEDKEYTF